MLCSLSGEEPKDPVVSPKSGAVFERRLVETYINTYAKDPVNDEPLTTQELISITLAPAIVPPKPPVFSSIPTMLASFQNEWDALALETFTLRKQLHTARQELSAALYQYDAAVRVAAQAMKDRDEAQAALEQISKAMAALSNGDKVEETHEETHGSAETHKETHGSEDTETTQPDHRSVPVELLVSARDALFAQHKKQKFSLPVTKGTTAEVAVTTEQHNVPGVSHLYVCPETKEKFLASLEQYSISPDEGETFTDIVSLGKAAGSPFVATKTSIKHGDTSIAANITAAVAHPLESLWFAITDSAWEIYDKEGRVFSSNEIRPTALAVHVDGVLVAVGVAGKVLIYDATTAEQAASLDTAHEKIRKIVFAANGYWLAVLSHNDDELVVELFDLRKNSLVHTVKSSANAAFSLDGSSQVLAVGFEAVDFHLYSKKGRSWHIGGTQATSGLVDIAASCSADDIRAGKCVFVGVTHDEVVTMDVALSV